MRGKRRGGSKQKKKKKKKKKKEKKKKKKRRLSVPSVMTRQPKGIFCYVFKRERGRCHIKAGKKGRSNNEGHRGKDVVQAPGNAGERNPIKHLTGETPEKNPTRKRKRNQT